MFFMKTRWKNVIFSHRCAFLFGLSDPYDSVVFTIRKPRFAFLIFSRFSQKMLQDPTQNRSTKTRKKMMPLETQNHPKMHQNPRFFPPTTPKLRQKNRLSETLSFGAFLSGNVSIFLSILAPKVVPENSRGPSFLSYVSRFGGFFQPSSIFWMNFGLFWWSWCPNGSKNDQNSNHCNPTNRV